MRRTKMTILGLCLMLALLQAHADDKTGELVYTGTRAGPFGEPADAAAIQNRAPQGIYAARLNSKTGQLSSLGRAVELQRATRLVTHPKLPIIYSTADPDSAMPSQSTIHSFAVDQASGRLKLINEVSSGGVDATDMHLDAASSPLFVANHNSGDVSALPLLAGGSLGPAASNQKDYGTGPNPRQKMPQAHGVTADPSHRYVLVSD